MQTRTFLAPFLCAALFLGGCNRNSATNSGASGSSNSPNELSIISAHPRNIQVEFERIFEEKYPQAQIKWVSPGASTDILAFVLGQYQNKAKTEGIGIDVYFGGGDAAFLEMEKAGLLASLPSDYGVPADLGGVPLRGAQNRWVAAALSGFGIFYNKGIAARDKLPVPQTWADMANPKLRNRIALADPRHSGSAHMAYEVILQTNGWDKGWQILTGMAGNARTFSTSSSGITNDVASGEAVVAPAIDFFAAGKIASAGGDKLGYVEPKGQSVVTPDPIGILRGAPHLDMAQKFVALVMSPVGQKLWMFKKGVPGGPTGDALGRKAALPAVYQPLSPSSVIRQNPYAAQGLFKFDARRAALRHRALNDLLGAVLIDNQDAIKVRWAKTPDAARLAFVPVKEAELTQLGTKWNDQAFRNATVEKWKSAARVHFRS